MISFASVFGELNSLRHQSENPRADLARGLDGGAKIRDVFLSH
jgi:hypothetical protein